MLRLRTLGALDLRNREGSELRVVLAQPRRLALLAYLGVASPHGFHRRDRLLALFWPEHKGERARASLNRAVYFLRHALGDDILQSRGDEEIGLDQDRFWCDAGAFGDALENHRYREALELYRGDILPGFFVSDAPGFEEWLESERARLKERASVAAWALADEEEKAGNLAPAAQWARRGLELSPFREVGLRRLLALLDRAGDRAGAAYAYERFAEEITAELDLDPSPETRALIDAIRSRANLRADTSTSPPNELAAAIAGPQGQRASDERIAGRPVAAGEIRPEGHPTPVRAPRTKRRTLVWTLPLAALGAVLLTGNVVLARDEALDPTRVDVATFENRTGDPSLDNLARTVTDRIIGGLAQTGLWKSIAPVQQAELGVWRAAWAGLTGLGKPTKRERGSVTVSGALTRDRGQLRIHAWLTDPRHDKRLWEVPALIISPTSADQVTDEVRQRVIGGAAVLRSSDSLPTTLQSRGRDLPLDFASLFPVATPPPTFEAYQEFLEGTKLHSQGQIHDALQRFRWAAAIDTTFTWPLVHGGMVCLAWYLDDLTAQADSFIKALTLVRSRVMPLQQHLLDHLLAVRAEDWVGVYRATREAARLAPEYYSDLLARKALDANRPREAVEALTRPGMDSIYKNDMLGYWTQLTRSWHSVGEHRNELDAARRARGIQPSSASALFQEIRALAALGRVDAVRARLDTLRSLPKEEWLTPAFVMFLVARELRAHDHTEAATETIARAIAWYRSRPAEEQASQLRREQLARELYFAGRWDESESVFRELHRQCPTSFEYPDNVEYLGMIGAIAARRGDRTVAESMAEKLVSRERPQPRPGQEAIVHRARIAALLGDRDRAMSLLRDAFGAQGTTALHGEIDWEGMRDYPPFVDFIRPKR